MVFLVHFFDGMAVTGFFFNIDKKPTIGVQTPVGQNPLSAFHEFTKAELFVQLVHFSKVIYVIYYTPYIIIY